MIKYIVIQNFKSQALVVKVIEILLELFESFFVQFRIACLYCLEVFLIV